MSVRYSARRASLASMMLLARVALRRQTYLNVLYLIAAFPLGLAYLIFLVVGLALGFGLSFILVGVPILFGVGAAWWRLGAFERELAIWWLGADIPPMPQPAVASASRRAASGRTSLPPPPG